MIYLEHPPGEIESTPKSRVAQVTGCFMSNPAVPGPTLSSNRPLPVPLAKATESLPLASRLAGHKVTCGLKMRPENALALLALIAGAFPATDLKSSADVNPGEVFRRMNAEVKLSIAHPPSSGIGTGPSILPGFVQHEL
jgi:hypothetical protein